MSEITGLVDLLILLVCFYGTIFVVIRCFQKAALRRKMRAYAKSKGFKL